MNRCNPPGLHALRSMKFLYLSAVLRETVAAYEIC